MDSPMTKQAAQNLGIDLKELHPLNDDQIRKQMRFKSLPDSQFPHYKEQTEKLRLKKIEEVRVEAERITAKQVQNPKDDLMQASTSTSFYWSPERCSQKIEDIRKKKERDLQLLIQEEVRIMKLNEELNRKYDTMFKQQEQLKQYNEAKRLEHEQLKQQQIELHKQNQDIVNKKRDDQLTAMEERERQRLDRENKKFLIRNQMMKDQQMEKDGKLKQASHQVKQAYEQEQQRIEQMLMKQKSKERHVQEFLEYQQHQQLQKMNTQREDYEKRIADIRTKIEILKIQLETKNEKKQKKIEQKVQEIELEKIYKRNQLKQRSTEQLQKAKSAQLRKHEFEAQRQEQIEQALKQNNEAIKQFEEYQKQIQEQRRLQTLKQSEQFQQKRSKQEQEYMDYLHEMENKTMQGLEKACQKAQNQKQNLAEYLQNQDKLKSEQVKDKLNQISERDQMIRSQQFQRTTSALLSAGANATKKLQEHQEQLLFNDLLRQVSNQTNLISIRRKDFQKRQQIQENMDERIRKLQTLDQEKSKNQRKYSDQLGRLQYEHQELKKLFERTRNTGKYEEMFKYIENHPHYQLSTSMSQLFIKTPKNSLKGDTKHLYTEEIIAHGDHSHPKTEAVQAILSNHSHNTN